jgi:predicted nucleic acid-binding protein
MLLVDTTVWIDYFNGRPTPEANYLDAALASEIILVGDIILAEVLQGFRDDADFEAARHALEYFQQVSLLDGRLAIQSARNYRSLRRLGVTVRKTIDCFIATYCIENQVPLLHTDRDFDPFEEHLGLIVVHPEQRCVSNCPENSCRVCVV